MSHSLWSHRLQHTSLLCPLLSPAVFSDSSPLSWWWYLTISSSASPFSFHLLSFPASGSFPISPLFPSSGQNIGASATILPMNIQGWFPLGLTGLICLQSKKLSRVFSDFLTCVQVSQEAGKVFKNFQWLVVIHTVIDFSIVNEAEVDVFLESPCFIYDPTNVGSLISSSSVFSKPSLYIWKF